MSDTPPSTSSDPPPRPRVVPRQRTIGERTIRIGVPHGATPRVETLRGPDGRIAAIEVHCRCGEVVRIDCQYAEEPPQ